MIWVRGAAHGADGSVAVCGDFGEHYPNPPGSGNVSMSGGSYLALFAAAMPRRGLVRTDPYAPFGVGVEYDAAAEFFPFSNSDVGVYEHGLLRLWRCVVSGGSGLYYEITADGKVNRYPGLSLNAGQTALFEDLFSLALTDSGTVFISKLGTGPRNGNLVYTLDRAKGAWVVVPIPAGGSPATLNFMYGGSGNTIVMQTDDRMGLGLRFFSGGGEN